MKIYSFLFFAITLIYCLLLQACTTISALKRAESKAVRYLDSVEISYDHAILYVHLQGKYRLPELNFVERLEAYEAKLRSNSDELSGKILKNLQQYRGLADVKYSIEKTEIEESVDLNYLVLSALYCDDHPIDTVKYFKELLEKSTEGDYALTHSLLALYLLNHNKCFNEADLESYRKYMKEENLAMISETGYTWNDINIESVALLQELGYKLPRNQLKQILKIQQKDGGWRTEVNEQKTSAHTTVLALWAILAYKNRLR